MSWQVFFKNGPAFTKNFSLTKKLFFRSWHQKGLEQEPNENPYIILDEYDIAANIDRCCNNSFGRTARQFVWHTGMHGLKYLVFCRKHLWERLLWALICLLAAILGLYFAAMALTQFYRQPTIIHLSKVTYEVGCTNFCKTSCSFFRVIITASRV